MNTLDRPLCRVCARTPAAFPGVAFSFTCWPKGPVTPPPCLSCGRRTLYFLDGRCRRCHPDGYRDIGSCPHCLAWGTTAHRDGLCKGCISWQDRYGANTAACASCSRKVPLDAKRFCRLCRRQAAMLRSYPLDVPAANRAGQQLFLADLFWRPRRRAPEPPPPPAPVTGVAEHEQLELFTATIDLRRGITGLPPPPDPGLAARLQRHVREHGARYGWSQSTTTKVRYGVRVLLSLQQHPGEPITWTQTEVLKNTGLPARPVREALKAAGMLRDDRTLRTIEKWFEAKVADLPEPMTEELGVWSR